MRTLDMLAMHGWSRRRCVPHGGHQFALNIAVGLGLGGNESYPQVFAPFGGFADECKVTDSRVPMPDVPGIGFEAKNKLYAVMTEIGESHATRWLARRPCNNGYNWIYLDTIGYNWLSYWMLNENPFPRNYA